MASKDLPSPETLCQLLCYDPDAGVLVWRPRPMEMFPRVQSANTWNTRYAGKVAFATLSHGYHQGRIFGVAIPAHRACWAIHYGEWPSQEVDHINMDRSDNRIVNLRLASSSENKCNRTKMSTNTSGYKGVSWHKASKMWRATIGVGGGQKALGYFRNAEDAYAAYCHACAEEHSCFANAG